MFSVQLSAVSQIPGFAAGVRREAAASTIEPYGVVQLSEATYIGREGGYVRNYITLTLDYGVVMCRLMLLYGVGLVLMVTF